MKNIISIALLFSLGSLVGCAHVLVRPQADQVKKVAIVSVYMNRQIYNVEAPKQGGGEGLGALVQAAATATATTIMDSALGDIGGFQPVVTYTLKTYSDNLSIPNRWEVVSPTEIVGHQSYKDFLAAGETGDMAEIMKGLAKVTTAEFVGVDGMIVIPIGSVVEAGSTYHFGDSTSSHEKLCKSLGKLATDLGVDGVAIVEIDAAYEKAFMQYPMGLTRATSNVSTAAVIVNKNGDVALKTPLIDRAKGDRFEGETVGMLNDQYVAMREAEVQSSYNEAIEKSAVALREKIVEEFGN